MSLKCMLSCALVATVLVEEVARAGWTAGPPLNIPRVGPGACVGPDGTIYVVGGTHVGCCPNDETSTAEMLPFDGTSYATSWESLPLLITKRSQTALVCANGFLYAIGGSHSSGPLASVERLDLLDGDATWEDIVDLSLPMPLAGPGAAVDNFGRIWVIGVTAADETKTYIYDPARPSTWSQGPPPATSRIHNCVIGVAADRLGRIYAMGGCGAGGVHLAAVERIDPAAQNPQWEFVAPIPPPVSNTDLPVLGADGRLYVAGGWLPGVTDRVVRYDPDLNEWVPWIDLDVPRNLVGLVLGRDGRIFAIGGDLGAGDPTDQVEILTRPCGADGASPMLLDNDAKGEIEVVDLLALLAKWGPCP